MLIILLESLLPGYLVTKLIFTAVYKRIVALYGSSVQLFVFISLLCVFIVQLDDTF